MKPSLPPEELWEQQKNELKLLFPQLTDNDFRYDYGQREVMMTKLQTKLGRTREELTASMQLFKI